MMGEFTVNISHACNKKHKCLHDDQCFANKGTLDDGRVHDQLFHMHKKYHKSLHHDQCFARKYTLDDG